MSDGQIFGAAIAAMIVFFCVLFALYLFFGAYCLHWSAKFLKFKKPRLKTAFVTQLINAFVPAFAWGGALFAMRDHAELEMVVGTLASVLSFFVCVTVVRTMYGVGFGRAITGYLLSNAIATVILIGIGLLILLTLAALGWSDLIPFRRLE